MSADNNHIHYSATCFLGSASIITDRLFGEAIVVEWSLVPLSLGILFVVMAIRHARKINGVNRPAD